MKKILSLILLFSSCAVVVRPTGGDKDEQAPVALKSIPDSASTNFNNNEIRIYFDEYFEIKEPNNILISPPPVEKPKIQVINKYLSIQFKEELQSNTTYSISLISALHDINEKNILPHYNLTFSTGNEIDTGIIQGTAILNYTGKAASNYTVALFHSKYSDYPDSLIYPLFISKTDESGHFQINGIKTNQYYSLYAFDDINHNKKFDVGENMGFITDSISTLDTPTIQIAQHRIIPPITYFTPIVQDARTFKLPYKSAPHQKAWITSKHQSFDKSQQLYFHSITNDTLLVLDYIKSSEDTLLTYYLYSDTLSVDTIQVHFKSKNYLYPIELSSKNTLINNSIIEIQSQQPIRSIQKDLVSIQLNDTIPVPFKLTHDLFTIQIQMDIEEKQSYGIQFFPKSIQFLDATANDTLAFDFISKESNSFGDLAILFDNKQGDSIRVELLSDIEKDPIYSLSTKSDSVYFKQIIAGDYHIRLIQILPNKFPNHLIPFKIQPSYVYIHPTTVNIRGGWVVGDFRINNSQQNHVENEE